MHIIPFKIDPPIIAHRGASRYAPENTLAAFLKAKQLGIKWVEFDVRLTSDDQVIVFHDDRLERTTNGVGLVREHPWDYLQTLDAGSWFNEIFASERIPSFSDTILFLQAHQMAANIELKANKCDEAKLAAACNKILACSWEDQNLPFFISSFSIGALKQIRLLSSDYTLGLLLDRWRKDWKDIADELNCAFIDVNEKCLDDERIEMIHQTKRRILAYTVNNANRAKQLFAQGVDAVFSDCPDQLLNIHTG